MSEAVGAIEYTHADGTVQRAESLEQARSLCPVLGNMAIEQVNMLLALAELGKAEPEQQELELELVIEEVPPAEPDTLVTETSPSKQRDNEPVVSEVATANQHPSLKEPVTDNSTGPEPTVDMLPPHKSAEPLPPPLKTLEVLVNDEPISADNPRVSDNAKDENRAATQGQPISAQEVGTVQNVIIVQGVAEHTTETSVAPSTTNSPMVEVAEADTIQIPEVLHDHKVETIALEGVLPDDSMIIERPDVADMLLDKEPAKLNKPGTHYEEDTEATVSEDGDVAVKPVTTTIHDEASEGALDDNPPASSPAAEIVFKLIENVHGTTSSEQEPAAQAIIEAIATLLDNHEDSPLPREKLREQLIALFQQLEFPQDTDEIERLLDELLPDITTEDTIDVSEILDSEDKWTHETYHKHPLLATVLSDVEHTFEQLVGKLALLSSYHHLEQTAS